MKHTDVLHEAKLKSNVISVQLAERQGLTQDAVNAIELLHRFKDDMFDLCRNVYVDGESGGFVLALEQIEFSMQRLWEFEESSAHHTWWYQIPGCTCPKLDNQDMMGIDQRIISCDCPFHGTRT